MLQGHTSTYIVSEKKCQLMHFVRYIGVYRVLAIHAKNTTLIEVSCGFEEFY